LASHPRRLEDLHRAVGGISNTQKGDEKQTLNSVKKMFKQYPPEQK
jgi:hypothetical protein